MLTLTELNCILFFLRTVAEFNKCCQSQMSGCCLFNAPIFKHQVFLINIFNKSNIFQVSILII